MTAPSFSRGSLEGKAYEAVLGQGISADSVDTGCHRLDYAGRTDGTTTGRGDHKIDACESWEAFAAQAQLLAPTVKKLFGAPPPWVFPDKPSADLQAILQRIDKEIERLRARPGKASDAPLRLALGLYHFVVSDPPRGLGVQFVDKVQEHNAGEVLTLGEANCSEFFSTLRAVFRRAGIDVFPVFVFTSSTGDALATEDSPAHIATAFRHGDKTYLIDASYDGFDTRHRRWAPLSLREFWAWHYNNRALISADADDMKESEKFFARARQLDPNNPHFPNNLGLRRQDAGLETEAAAAFREAIQLDPKFGEAYANLGGLLISQKKYREARTLLAQGLAAQPHHPGILYNIAMAKYEQGHLAPALKYVDRAIRADKNAADFYSLRGNILYRLGRDREAAKSYGEAERLAHSD